jgi:ParB family chromosome partitioning protein
VADTLKQLTHAELRGAPHNVRRAVGDVAELAQSIDGVGLLQPIVARKNGDGYEIIAGHRRHAAIGLLIEAKRFPKDSKWPVIVKTNVDTALATADMLVENLHRSGLTPIEEMNGYLALANEHGWKVKDISTATGVPETTIKQRLSWAKLPEHVLVRVDNRTVTLDLASKIAGLSQQMIDDLCAKSRIPSEHDIRQAKEQRDRENLQAKMRALVDKHAKPLLEPARFDKILAAVLDDPALSVNDKDPAVAAIAHGQAIVNSSRNMEWKTRRLRPDLRSFEDDVMGAPVGAVFTVGERKQNYYTEHGAWIHWVAAAAEDDEDEPETDWDRAVDEAQRAHEAKLREHDRYVNKLYTELLARPLDTLVDEALAARLEHSWQIKNNNPEYRVCLGLDPHSGPDLTTWVTESRENTIRAAWLDNFRLGLPDHLEADPSCQIPPLPKREGFPDPDEYDDDGNYIGPQGEPKREDFDTDEEWAAAKDVWEQYRLEKAEAEEYAD